MTKLSVDQALLKAQSHAKKGEIEEATKIYSAILHSYPKNIRAKNGLAVLNKKMQKEPVGISLQDAVNGLLKTFNRREFETTFKMAVSLSKKFSNAFQIWQILGIVSAQQKRFALALEAFEKVILLNPGFPDAYCNKANVLKETGDFQQALVFYDKAIKLNPALADAYTGKGAVLQTQKKFKESIEVLNKALEINPNLAESYNNLGTALIAEGRLDDASDAFKKALALNADYTEVHVNMGNVLSKLNKHDKAIKAYCKALVINPNSAKVRGQKLRQQAQICDWDGISEDLKLIPELGIYDKEVSPFALLSLEDAPDRHKIRSEVYSKANFPQKPLAVPAKPVQSTNRIRIGYFSSDFKEHPVAYLIAKVLEKHNRNKFEIFGYSIHGKQHDRLGQRLINSFDFFADVQGLSDKDVALKARHDNIDIAIDLNGYTLNSRTGIFAYRAAPIQINFLGYPGTMGAHFMDYIVADKHLIPPENQKYFTEKQIYLPNTYMPTDNTRTFSNHSMARMDMGLPADSFVFCCFNNNYKITSLEFDIWMRLLTQVKGSTLWLRQSNQLSELNIKKEALKRKVNPERIVFAGRVPMDEHLARQRLADLFIDTFSFNAHTTAAEALWAGVPIVTRMGQGFASRVAGSLLKSVGLPELITTNEHDYEMLILELATKPSKLQKIRQKLAKNRLEQPLFDTEQYTKHIEEGFQKAYQNYCAGNTPQTIFVQK